MRSISCPPVWSKRHTSTLVALAENSEKLTPLPSQLAPIGIGTPSRTELDDLATIRSPSCADKQTRTGHVRSLMAPRAEHAFIPQGGRPSYLCLSRESGMTGQRSRRSMHALDGELDRVEQSMFPRRGGKQ